MTSHFAPYLRLFFIHRPASLVTKFPERRSPARAGAGSPSRNVRSRGNGRTRRGGASEPRYREPGEGEEEELVPLALGEIGFSAWRLFNGHGRRRAAWSGRGMRRAEMDRFARVSRAQKLSVRSRPEELAAVAGAMEGPPRRLVKSREKERKRESGEKKRSARSSPPAAYRSDGRKKENEGRRDKARGMALCNF